MTLGKREEIKESQPHVLRVSGLCCAGVAIWKQGCISQVSRRHCSPAQFQRQAVCLSPRGAVMLKPCWAEGV